MSPRNILFLMTDQHRTDTLGCYGNEHVRTPALDSLAAEGTLFTECYTPSAICTPARGSLLTGQLPFRHQLLANFERNVGYRDELADDAPVFSTALRDAGYNVGHAGKWHAGRVRGPEHYGFDGEHLAGPLNPLNHPSYLSWLDRRSLPHPVIRDEIRGSAPNGGPGFLIAGKLNQMAEATCEAFLTDLAIQRLTAYAEERRTADRPFFLSCHWFGPHLPYLLPESHFDMYDPALVQLPASMTETFRGKPKVQQNMSKYWACDDFDADEWRKLIAVYWGYVTLIDEQVARLLDALRDLGLWDETAVFFTADHGEFTGSHRLNDKGPAMYDDIYRIPAIVRVPGAPSGTSTEFTTLTDLNPTIRELCGLEPGRDCDGRSLVPLIEGDTPPDWPQHVTGEYHGHHFPYPQRMIRTRDFKLVINPESVNELYDLTRDPHELLNVYDVPAYRDTRRRLSLTLYRELQERGDNFFQWMTYTADIDQSERWVNPESIDSKL